MKAKENEKKRKNKSAKNETVLSRLGWYIENVIVFIVRVRAW